MTAFALKSGPIAPFKAACAHCALPVPAGLIETDAAHQFCCTGCRTAYQIINGCGLGRYYHVRDESSTGQSPVRATGKRYAEMDDPQFGALYVTTEGGGARSAELFLEGVHCAACVWLVERLPQVLPGVVEARLDPRRALVRVLWNPDGTSLSAIARALDSLGYIPHPAREARQRSVRRIDDRKMLIRLGVAGACAGNVMLLALALYSGALSFMEPQYLRLFLWLSMAISLVSLAWPGSVFFRGAWGAIRTRTPHLDLPISLGLAAGAIWGVVNTIRGSDQVYFDSLSVLVFALLVGRAIQQRQQRWSSDALELLFSITPGSARRIEPGGAVAEVPVEALTQGDLVEVLAGDSIPVDGVVESGDSSIDQSLLTGESMPVPVARGDGVTAGAVNLSAPLRVRALSTGESTRLGKLMRMVEEGARRRAPIVRLADRIAAKFVVGMLILSSATLALWLFIDPSRALDNAAALLIVTCPCAVGLATPLAITVAIGRGAKRSVLIKGGDALEALSRPGVIFFDKTGTITRARMSMVSWHGPEDIQPLVSALESSSSHPIARALVDALGRSSLECADVQQSLGLGIQGSVNDRRVAVGSSTWIRVLARTVPSEITEAERACVASGLAPVLVSVDGEVRAVAGVGDPVREDALSAVRTLQRAGWDVRMLSGDHPDVVAAVARSLGITEARGGATPEDKLRVVTDCALTGPVVMVGDGVNDAAALAAATVGIAVHGGAEASLAAADVYLSQPGLAPILELLGAARSTLGVIRTALGASLFYNVLAGSLAAAGVLNPIIAAIIMPVSSLTVVALAFRARTFRGNPCR